MILRSQDFPEFLEALKALGETDKDKAAALGVQSTKTIERLRRRLPSAFRPFVSEPRLLRALLNDLERKAA